jgi:1-acyl-sn-glycerol-3-phosphate acyltransferase/nucleoside-diphosphate-sugar epimerase
LAERLGAALEAELGQRLVRVLLPDGTADEPGADPREALPLGLSAIVLLADRSQPDAELAERWFAAAAAAGARHLLLISSAEAVAPHHYHPGWMAEDHPRARCGGNPIADRWLALEAAAERAVCELVGDNGSAPGRLTLLRPPPVPVAGGEDFWSRWLTAGRSVTVAGFDPTVQFLAVEDLATAVVAVLAASDEGAGDLAGVVHVAPAGAIPVRAALRRAGVRRLPLPGPLGGLPAERRAYLCHSWTVGSARLRAATGWRPRRTSAEVVDALAADGGRTGKASSATREVIPAAVPATQGGYDDFGLDRAYVRRHDRGLLGFLHDRYWRVEQRGIEPVPRSGRAVLVGIHRGFMPFDGVMALLDVMRAHDRFPRFLIHPALIKYPGLANFINKLGGVVACRENAAHVLERDELLGFFPEGIRGAFSLYRDAYQLKRFGRDEYVKVALRHRALIVPFVTLGSAEIFPILGRIRWRWFERTTEWPFLPITPTLNLLPLPSKWHTWYLEPLDLAAEHGPEAADDPQVVRQISAEVRRRMERALTLMRERRTSFFWGSILDELPEEAAGAGTER